MAGSVARGLRGQPPGYNPPPPRTQARYRHRLMTSGAAKGALVCVRGVHLTAQQWGRCSGVGVGVGGAVQPDQILEHLFAWAGSLKVRYLAGVVLVVITPTPVEERRLNEAHRTRTHPTSTRTSKVTATHTHTHTRPLAYKPTRSRFLTLHRTLLTLNSPAS